jgi:alcohol dehydrogenase class IV
VTCCHYYAISEGHESAFAVDISSIVFGPGVLEEAGEHARALGMKRAALFTDKRVGSLR